MANLHITEFSTQARDTAFGSALVPAAQMPPVAEQTLAIGATSAACTNAFNAATRFICLTAKADCHIQIGAAPVATASMRPLTAGNDYYFGVTPGHKVAVILP
ncbi:MAG: hypothetical protein KAX65_08815 [Caldilineaceae bacterium]|nr:hypothetical protein [Caldilineaceae bacterium]